MCKLDDQYLFRRSRQHRSARRGHSFHPREDDRACYHNCQSNSEPYPNFDLVEAYRVAGRPLVSARRDLRCNYRKLDFYAGRCRLARRDSRSFPNLNAYPISHWRSRPLISHAASLVHTRLACRWYRLRGHRCEQPCFLALLSELRLDKGAHDRNWRVPFALHPAHEDCDLRVTRRANRRVGSRRRICGTWRHGRNLGNAAMARYFQRDMVSTARTSADVNKWFFDIVADPRILFLILPECVFRHVGRIRR